MMAFTRFKKFKTYVEKAYLKKSQKNNLRFNFKLYFYWYNKCIANHFSRTLRRQLENLHKTSSISLMLNVAAPVALVVLFAIMPHSIIQTSESFNNAVSLMPLGLILCKRLLLLRSVSVFLLTQDDVAIRNYIVLTQLLPDLQQIVDEKKIIFSPAYQIAALTHEKQGFLLEGIDSE